MKVKLNTEEISKLEKVVLNVINSNKMEKIKLKFKSPRNGEIHLSNNEYLFLLDSIESRMTDSIYPIYDILISQDSKDLVKPIYVNESII
jgi:hypothetical protein